MSENSYESIENISESNNLYETVQEVTEISTPRLKSDLSEVSRLRDATMKKRENSIDLHMESNFQEKTHIERTEKIEDFVRNFLLKRGLNKTLQLFQTEWYEIKSKTDKQGEDEDNFPDIYLHNQALEDRLKNLQIELEDAKNYANKIKMTWEKLRKERDYHRLHHSRVQQEKGKLNQEIEKMKGVINKQNDEYQELKQTYENSTKYKMLLKLEKDRLQSKIDSLNKTVANLESRLKETSKSMTPQDQMNSSMVTKKEKTNRPGKDNPLYTPVPKPLVNPYEGEEIQTVMNKQLGSIKTFKGHMQTISRCKMYGKKPFLATASDDMTWKLWHMPRGELLMSGEGHNDWISDIAFHPRGTHLATSSGDCTIKIWDFLNISCAWTFRDFSQPVWSLDFNHSGEFLISGAMDHSCRLYDIPYGKCRYNFRGHVDSVNYVKFSKYSNFFVSGSSDKTLSLWDIKSGLLSSTLYGHLASVNSVQLSENENTLVSCDADGIVKQWDLRTMKCLGEANCGPHSANGIAIDPSGNLAFVACEDCTVRVVNLKDFNDVIELKGHEDSVQDIVFDPFNKQIISCSADLSFKTWG